jgi:hypothetical protein
MIKADKLLTRMRRKPAGDWTIQDIERLCGGLGWQCLPPTGGGSHWKITAVDEEAILTTPAKRPSTRSIFANCWRLIERRGDGEAD